jgi:hypothetical protein
VKRDNYLIPQRRKTVSLAVDFSRNLALRKTEVNGLAKKRNYSCKEVKKIVMQITEVVGPAKNRDYWLFSEQRYKHGPYRKQR